MRSVTLYDLYGIANPNNYRWVRVDVYDSSRNNTYIGDITDKGVLEQYGNCEVALVAGEARDELAVYIYVGD
jgi:hypothetical protein